MGKDSWLLQSTGQQDLFSPTSHSWAPVSSHWSHPEETLFEGHAVDPIPGGGSAKGQAGPDGAGLCWPLAWPFTLLQPCSPAVPWVPPSYQFFLGPRQKRCTRRAVVPGQLQALVEPLAPPESRGTQLASSLRQLCCRPGLGLCCPFPAGLGSFSGGLARGGGLGCAVDSRAPVQLVCPAVHALAFVSIISPVSDGFFLLPQMLRQFFSCTKGV